ncbi:MAG: hypothetical protein MRZ79_07825 [Bacteroidia bacterium]|nr:hypothetical protein [Bacteroidia bacterium]
MNKLIFAPQHAFRRLFLGLSLVALASISTGCFDIKEKISLKKDGSGSYSMVMDMSEIGKMMESMGGAPGGEDPFAQMDSAIDETAASLRSSKGISNVVTKSENFVVTISYDFASIQAVNDANANMGAETAMIGQGGDGPNFDLDIKKRVFKRASPDFGDVMGSLGADDESLEMAKMMLGGAKYTMTYTMPGKIKSMTNQDAVIGEDGKTVTLKASFLDLLESKTSVGNEIVFKKK